MIHIIRRPRELWAEAQGAVMVNGGRVVNIKNGEQVAFPIEPGEHEVQIKVYGDIAPLSSSPKITISVRPGQDVELACWVFTRREWLVNRLKFALQQETWRSPTSTGPSGEELALTAGSLVEILEGSRTEEDLGEEARIVDNSGSDSGVTRSVKVSREWTRTVTVAHDQATARGSALTIGPGWANLKIQVDQTLRHTYGIGSSVRELTEEEIILVVPPRRTVRLLLRWKRVWQHGLVRVSNSGGGSVEVPFRALVGVTFDQLQQDAS
ncbi:hypothetical protein [Longispora fulva]|uniref:Uncharacterized protein n=1 Tax=Longispora fulva TaxID=619741 RepID=A0A8J7GDZ6_9ACTN|nr:hypothetical protein [Longispora fulva]MBG6133973.1 hypothetical protein [Longispora fulva]